MVTGGGEIADLDLRQLVSFRLYSLVSGPLNLAFFCQEEVDRLGGIGRLNCDIRVWFHPPSEIVLMHRTSTRELYPMSKSNTCFDAQRLLGFIYWF